MSILFSTISELRWILVEGIFILGYVMFCEFVGWAFEVGASYPLGLVPIRENLLVLKRDAE